MNELVAFLNTPWGGAIAAILLSGAIRALPTPPDNAGLFYRWLFNFAQFLLSNYDKVLPKPTSERGEVK